MKTLLFSPRPLFLASVACLIFSTGFVAGAGGLKTESCIKCRERHGIIRQIRGNIVDTASCWDELYSHVKMCLPLYARIVGNCAQECTLSDYSLDRLNYHIESTEKSVKSTINDEERPERLSKAEIYLSDLRRYAEATKDESLLNHRLPMYEQQYRQRRLEVAEVTLARLVVRCEDVPNLERRIQTFENEDRRYDNLYGETIARWYSVLKVYCPLVLASQTPLISSVPAESKACEACLNEHNVPPRSSSKCSSDEIESLACLNHYAYRKRYCSSTCSLPDDFDETVSTFLRAKEKLILDTIESASYVGMLRDSVLLDSMEKLKTIGEIMQLEWVKKSCLFISELYRRKNLELTGHFHPFIHLRKAQD